jgi:hypothetical protein
LAARGGHAMLSGMSLGRQPDTGGRYSLRLLDHDSTGARFELTLATSDASWLAEARVSAVDGSVALDGVSPAADAALAGRPPSERPANDGASSLAPPPPPRWLVQYARAALRTAWHQHADQGWPRRLTRWRDVPARESESSGNRDFE